MQGNGSATVSRIGRIDCRRICGVSGRAEERVPEYDDTKLVVTHAEVLSNLSVKHVMLSTRDIVRSRKDWALG